MNAPGFDPSRHLTKLNGKRGPQDYLEVKWRLVWLVEKSQADGVGYAIDTDVIELTTDRCVCKATVTIQNKIDNTVQSAVGIGSETAADFGDFIEKAQTKAVGRALAMLGFGTQFADADGFDSESAAGRIVDAPLDVSPMRPPAVERVPGGASKKQIAYIRKLAQEAGMDDRALHEFMAGETGKQSSNDLSSGDASKLIERLQPLASNPRN